MSVFFNCRSYIESQEGLNNKIIAIDNLIESMLLRQLEYIEDNDINLSEYWLNDGQVQLKTSFNSPMMIANTIKSLEQTKQIYVNRFNGRRGILRDIDSL